MSRDTPWRPDARVLRGRARARTRLQGYLMLGFVALAAAAPVAPLVAPGREALVAAWWGLGGLGLLLIGFQLILLRRLVAHRRAATPRGPRAIDTHGPIDFDKVWNQRRGSG